MKSTPSQQDTDRLTAGSPTILRLPGVQQRTGLGRSTIYREMAQGRFPRSVQLTLRSVGWRETDIDAWLEARPLAAH